MCAYQGQFLKRLGLHFLYLLSMSMAVYLRPEHSKPLLVPFEQMDARGYTRVVFELITCFNCFLFLVVQQSSEISNQGFVGFMKQLVTSNTYIWPIYSVFSI